MSGVRMTWFQTTSVCRPRNVEARKMILKNEGAFRRNKRLDFPMMPLCGRPEQYSRTRVVACEAAGRKRRAFVLPPRFFKSFSAGFLLHPHHAQ